MPTTEERVGDLKAANRKVNRNGKRNLELFKVHEPDAVLANKQHKAPNETSYAQLLGDRPAHRLVALDIHVAIQLAV